MAMPEIVQIQRSKRFDAWLDDLNDQKGKARILARLAAARFGSSAIWQFR